MLKVIHSNKRNKLNEIRARRWGTTHEQIKSTFMRIYGGHRDEANKVMNL